MWALVLIAQTPSIQPSSVGEAMTALVA